MKKIVKKVLPFILAILVGIAGGFGTATITKTEDGKTTITLQSSFQMELSDTAKPAEIETDEGTIITDQFPTVESVDGNQLIDENVLEELDFGKGETYPVDTPNAFKDATLNKCIDLDGKWGAQCVDLANAYWKSYSNRWFSTCGTGAAKGAWNCKEQNAGNDFDLVYNAKDIQAGDWLIFGNGTYGHVGMALGGEYNGYVALLGENQGGSACAGGGSATNIINISTKSFIGAFRPKIYIKPEPKPEPVIKPCEKIEVKKGDTLGDIMLKCEGKVTWGQAMKDYAKKWYSVKYKKYPTVYDGWVSEGHYGLFAGDVIEYRK